jgi:putative membrane-bound dehydrogenase-like protein
MRRCTSLLTLVTSLALVARAADKAESPYTVSGPRTPKEELATFRVPAGFRVELVAREPAVIDPVAIAFDENGRLFVAEMPGYPNAGVATGSIHSGRIKLLEDRDGDGYFEHCTTFAEGLRFPSGVMPWKGGLIAADAPDILYLEDTDGDGKADRVRRLYTGFGLDNVEQLINGLQWGLDNWVHGAAGSNGGTVRSKEKPDAPPVVLHNRDVRFRPEAPGSLEPTSGGSQYGLATDDWEQWFVATNSQHLRHVVLPDHYLRRNPALAVSAVTLDIPDHGAACKVYRISPFERWRVERTRRRAGAPDAQRYPSTELVPGGYSTSTCSPVVYTADLFPTAYRGNTLVCDPANNVIHRDLLEQHGATFVARRADKGREFFASTDTWCRPVSLTVGPDGALYVVDFYREVIETPLSLPDDIKANLNIESRQRGRIWRIVPEGAGRLRKPALGRESAEQLVEHLKDPNPWWRLTAQRLLVERRDRRAVPALRKLAREAMLPQARAHALWTLDGMKALDERLIETALKDPSAGVREQALRLTDSRLVSSKRLQTAVAALADDSSPRVRFQLAFTLGEANAPAMTAALARVARRDLPDPWTQTAVLSSTARCAPALLDALVRDPVFVHAAAGDAAQFLTRLAAVVATRAGETELARALGSLGEEPSGTWQVAVLAGLMQGLQNSPRPLDQIWDHPPRGLRDALGRVRPFFERAAATAADTRQAMPARLAAARLLTAGPFALAGPVLQKLLTPQTPGELQLAAVRSLSRHNSPQVADMLLTGWSGYSPMVRRESLEAVFATTERVNRLLDAIEHKQLPANQIEPVRLEQLRKHPDGAVRRRARVLLAGQVAPDRRKVVEAYRPALDLRGDMSRGQAVFKKTCSTCHRLDSVGVEVGPDLLSALRNKTSETLLIDILDPSREVDPRYINYMVTTQSGRVFTGIIAAETASSVTLRRAERAEDTILRSQIEEMQGTAKSLMPEGLESQLSKQDLADLIAYLQMAGRPKP